MEKARKFQKVCHDMGLAEMILVGGAVRDAQQGKDAKDFDFACPYTPDQVKEAIGDAMAILEMDQAGGEGKAKPVIRVRYEGEEYEVATYRTDGVNREDAVQIASSFREDSSRRDFTINGMGMDLHGNILDFHGGMKDLKNGVIHAIGNPKDRFMEDPDRCYRAVMFAARYGFSIEENTLDAIRWAVSTGVVAKNAPERVGKVMGKILSHPSRAEGVRLLMETGLMEVHLPEVAAMSGVEQEAKHHAEGDVWHHTLRCMGVLRHDAPLESVWATLLHDVGKPGCVDDPRFPDNRVNRDTNGKLSFFGHDKVGAEVAANIVKRLALSNQDIIVGGVADHMMAYSILGAKKSFATRMFGRPHAAVTMDIMVADCHGSLATHEDGTVAPNLEGLQETLDLWNAYLNAPPEVQQPCVKRDHGIDGRVMAAAPFSLNGKQIGEALAKIQAYYLDNPDASRDELLAVIQ